METLGRYNLLEDPGGAPVQLGSWRKAFNYALRCYATVRVIPGTAFPDEASREQFTREADIATRIRHPNIASVFPLESANGRYVYAMEFCDGEILSQRVASTGSVETNDALNIASQIATGLEGAVSAGLIHRDLTADNVLLMEDEEENISVKLLGLGLPSRREIEKTSATLPEADFRSPEEIAGNNPEVQSLIYSIAALLYFMQVGPEKYTLFRSKSLEGGPEVSLDQTQCSPEISFVLKSALCREPAKRTQTFAELVDLIDKARTGAIPPPPVSVAPPPQPAVEVTPSPELAEAPPPPVPQPTEPEQKKTEHRPGELSIPAEFLGTAETGNVLTLTPIPSEAGRRVVVHAGNSFAIGRAAGQLVTLFLPRNQANDKKSKVLSKVHVTARCEGEQVSLFDGNGIDKPSSNGSALNGEALSLEKPTPILGGGEIKLAMRAAEPYVVKVVQLPDDLKETRAITNIEEWRGPADGNDHRCSGAMLFTPVTQGSLDDTLWLLSVAGFGSAKGGHFNFSASSSLGAFHYFRGCFWIEQRVDESIVVEGVDLGASHIAPLASGFTVEVMDSKFRVEIGTRTRRSGRASQQAAR